MARLLAALAAVVVVMGFMVAATTMTQSVAQSQSLQPPPPAPTLGKYVMIGWNDLGMHCLSPRFRDMCILPPYNTIHAVIIRRAGEEPEIVTSGFRISYAIDKNTRVGTKTDFWSYEDKLFGKSLPGGTGLTGNRVSGTMKAANGVFTAEGVPVLPYLDDMTWQPYQKALLKATGSGVTLNATVVVPVSDEMNCAKCHATGKVASPGISTARLETNILTLHDKREGTKLMSQRPVLCAKCHSDNALGAAGAKGVPSMSEAIHSRHATITSKPACSDCHPGAKTKCNRSAISGMGPVGNDPNCEHCHGSLREVGTSIRNGRKPWLQEPTCAQCHPGESFRTGSKLYRNARGHGGVPCIVCHNSPHAWWPSTRADDNGQPLALQGNSKSLGYKNCRLCHTDGRTGTRPPHDDDD